MCRGRSSTSCGRRRRGVRRADRPERTQGVSGQDMKLQSAEHESVVLPAQLRGFLRLDPDLDHHRATVAVGRSGGAGIYQRLLSRYSMSVMNLADVRADGDRFIVWAFVARRMRLVIQQLVLDCQPSAKARLLHSLAMKKLTGLVATTMLVSGVGTTGFRVGFGCPSHGIWGNHDEAHGGMGSRQHPTSRVPTRLEEVVRLQAGRYKRLVRWSPESRAQRSPNMIVYKVTYKTD